VSWLEACYNLFIALLLFLSAGGIGRFLLYALQVEIEGLELLWFSLISGLGLLSVLIFFLGLVGLLYAWVFGFIFIILSFSAIQLLWQRRKRWWQSIACWKVFQMSDRLFQIVVYLLIGLCFSSILWILLTHALMPPNEWDEIAYHLAIPKLYITDHRIFYIPYIFTALWPMNNEMLFTAALLFKADIAPHFISLGMVLFTAIGLVLGGKRIGDQRVGIIAAALFCTIPLVKRLAGTALVDAPMGLYVLAGLLGFDRWRQTRRIGWLGLSGLLCGFVAGCKLTGAAFPVLFGLVVIARAWPWHQSPLRVVLWRGCLFALASLCVVAPWYMRSYVLTGNPIWPFAYQVFGGRNWDLLGDEYNSYLQHALWTPQIPRTLLGLIQSYEYVINRPSELGGYSGGIGVVLPLGAIFATAFIKRMSSLAAIGLFISAGFYGLWFGLTSLQVRYLLPIVPLLAFATASLMVVCYDALVLLPWRLGVLLALLAVLLNTWPWSSTGERELFASRWTYLSGEISRDAWLDHQVDILPVFRYANTHLPADARILLVPYENRTYYLDRDYVWGHPISQRIIRFESFHSEEELANALKAMRITFVIDNPKVIFEHIRYWSQIRALMLDLQLRCGETIYSNNDAVLYKLHDCTGHG